MSNFQSQVPQQGLELFKLYIQNIATVQFENAQFPPLMSQYRKKTILLCTR